jgi:DNA-binding MarR family transcriptional regulator
LQHTDETVQALVDLGLTVLQARVYIALASSGTLTGKAAAKEAKVASQDVYRILAELQEKSLVEKIINRPNKYRAISPEQATKSLIRQREEQTIELKRTVAKILKDMQNTDKSEEENGTNQFVLIPAKGPALNRLENGASTAKTHIDFAADFQSSMEGIEHLGFGGFTRILERGTKIRFLLNKPKKTNPTSKGTIKVFLALKRKPAFQVRFVQSPLLGKLQIKDNKEVLISTKQATSNENTPYLWSDNLIIVQVIQEWFNSMWNKASEN